MPDGAPRASDLKPLSLRERGWGEGSGRPGTHKPPLPTRSRNRSRELRGTSTEAERKLWQRLRGGQLNGLKFRRQHPIPPYIVDFHCDAAKLVVELDGSQHTDEADRVRTRHLESKGLHVLRFWDNDALGKTDAVLEAILSASNQIPSPSGRGCPKDG